MDAGGAVLLLFDIAGNAIPEHDHWHTQEHMPERLAIPGFLRGSRWIARSPGQRYCVLYEVAEPAVLESPEYRERLDHPTPWTSAMMKHYVGMSRTLCSVEAKGGSGLGAFMCLVRFAARAGREEELRQWLADRISRDMSERPGFSVCYLLTQAVEAAMTREQQIRGRDAHSRSSLVATGYDADLIASLADEFSASRLSTHGAGPDGYACGIYQQAVSLTSAKPLSPLRPSTSSSS